MTAQTQALKLFEKLPGRKSSLPKIEPSPVENPDEIGTSQLPVLDGEGLPKPEKRNSLSGECILVGGGDVCSGVCGRVGGGAMDASNQSRSSPPPARSGPN